MELSLVMAASADISEPTIENPLLTNNDVVEQSIDYKGRPVKRSKSGRWGSACFIIGIVLNPHHHFYSFNASSPLVQSIVAVVFPIPLSEEGPCEDLNGDGQLSSFNEWTLPAREFDGIWESLIYEPGLKQRLLRYAASALLFTEKGVDPFLVSWNRIILLHGPPGTGKTSLCKALAQKLSIRFSIRYPQCQLVEVNAHSLFSKWFSESGKLVVNALLTQMDKLKSSPNVIILTTSNITAAIDVAFVDRADIKAYVGPPTLQARYEILRSCLQELLRTGILSDPDFKVHHEVIIPKFAGVKEKLNAIELPESQALLSVCKQLLEGAELCEGLSGRSLRKLPFLAHAALTNPYCCDPCTFLKTLMETATRIRLEMPD